jgi:quinoprotein relay system zinc metallohydrolase 2
VKVRAGMISPVSRFAKIFCRSTEGWQVAHDRWRHGLAAVIAALAWSMTSALSAAPLEVSEIAPGVFVHQGVHEEFGDGYHGDIASIGFVIGEEAIAVIDTGGSFRVGSALRESIRVRSSLPIRYVINTHVHSDHIFGNAAFAQDQPAFIGHHKLPAAMRSRGPLYEENLARMLGEAAQGSHIVLPTRTVQDALAIDLGGRRLLLRAWPSAHTDHDLTVMDEKTATLWAGDLLFLERTPTLDGDLKGWLEAMKVLAASGAVRTVPGHGPVVADARPYFDKQRRYLQSLQDDVRRGLDEGLKLQQVTARAAEAERSQWLLFDSANPRNAELLYLQMEWE